MAKFVLKNCRVEVNGIDFSDHVSSATVHLEKDDVDTTSFSGSGREVVAGLKKEKITISFQQDFAAASVDATLWPLYNNETEFTVKVRPTSSAISATNPEYSATCVLLSYEPLAGKVGDLSDTSVDFNCQRVGIARATS
ncbi:hypothetical protein ACIRPT_02610 [Streptomyces sp. NPDC101227]|uniref:hypothetical protein n=1 Tax=Streptomyces sp. NPDC101227 TaxID=3366136 RepID=UPI003816A303